MATRRTLVNAKAARVVNLVSAVAGQGSNGGDATRSRHLRQRPLTTASADNLQLGQCCVLGRLYYEFAPERPFRAHFGSRICDCRLLPLTIKTDQFLVLLCGESIYAMLGQLL